MNVQYERRDSFQLQKVHFEGGELSLAARL